MHQLQPTRMDLTPKFPETTSLTSFSILEDAGAALARLSGFVNGKAVSLLPEVDLRLLASEYAIDSNRIFQKVASPLFPIANRLRDPRAEPDVSIDPNDPSGHATLLGTNVRFPMNHRGSGDASPPHHLHGSLFRRRADSTITSEGPRTASTESIFKTRPLTNWAEEVEVTIRHSLSEGKYRYELRAKNRGEHSVPIGMGAHPYFQLPSGDPKSARLFLPSIRVAEIDGLGNVFPTGRWISVPQSRFDFCSPAPLPYGGFDHFSFLIRSDRAPSNSKIIPPASLSGSAREARISSALSSIIPEADRSSRWNSLPIFPIRAKRCGGINRPASASSLPAKRKLTPLRLKSARSETQGTRTVPSPGE